MIGRHLKIESIEKILNMKLGYETIKDFRDNYEPIRHDTDIAYLLCPKKIPKFNKRKNEIKEFAEKYQDIINQLQESDMLYDLCNGIEFGMYWPEYSIILKKLFNSDKDKIFKLLEKLKEYNCSEIEFVNSDFSNIFYEEFHKDRKDQYEIEYMFSDGEKTYLAQYYSDTYPVIFKNAHIIFVFKNGKSFYNRNRIYINSFDIDVDNIDFVNSEEEILERVDFNEIKKYSKMCNYIRYLIKQEEAVKYTISSLQKLLDNKELSKMTKSQLDTLNKQKEELQILRENIINKYIELNYDKTTIDISLKYLQEAEWNSSIDID